MPNRWPFLYERNDAMLSLRRVFQEGAPIRLVVHGADGGYQFLDGEDCTDDDACVVELEEVLKLDPTIAEVACLLPGFSAYRESPDDAWRVFENDEDDEEGEENDAG